MPYINNHTIMGHLGQDVELRYLASGTAVAELSIATTEKWKDKQTGEQKERTDWHKVSLFGKSAEWAGEHRKGELVWVSGPSRTDKWQDKNGQDRYTTKIYAREVKWFQRGDGNQPAQSQDNGGSPAPDFDDECPF